MNFRNDNIEGWMQHAPHLQFNNKSIRFAKTEYHRVWSETTNKNKSGVGNKSDLYQGRNRKKTSNPKRLQEHVSIAEFLLLNFFSTETEDRKYNQQSIYYSLAGIITKLEDEMGAEKSTRWMDKVVSPEEQELATIVDWVFDADQADIPLDDDDEVYEDVLDDVGDVGKDDVGDDA